MRLSNLVVHGGSWIFTDDDVLENVTIYDAKVFFHCTKMKLINVSIYSSRIVYNTETMDLQDYDNLTIKYCELYSSATYISEVWAHGI